MSVHGKEKPVSETRLSSALSDAQSIIDAAEKRAAELKAEAEKVYREAKEQGYQAGLKLGHDEVAANAVRLIEESTSISEALASEAAQLALAISSQIIEEQVKVSTGVVKKMALRALRESVIGETVVVMVNPLDCAALESIPDELRRVANGVSVKIESDPQITRGGCIVRTDFGEVDASVEALVGAVYARLGITKS